MSGKLAKSQVPFLPRYLKTPDVMEALSELKTHIRAARPLEHFHNNENQLPRNADGHRYFEFRVGGAHAGDERPAGQRRFVVEATEVEERGQDRGIAGNIAVIYYSPAHYAKHSFYRLP